MNERGARKSEWTKKKYDMYRGYLIEMNKHISTLTTVNLVFGRRNERKNTREYGMFFYLFFFGSCAYFVQTHIFLANIS